MDATEEKELLAYMHKIIDTTIKDKNLSHLSTEQLTDLFRDAVVSFYLKKAIREKDSENLQ